MFLSHHRDNWCQTYGDKVRYPRKQEDKGDMSNKQLMKHSKQNILNDIDSKRPMYKETTDIKDS